MRNPQSAIARLAKRSLLVLKPQTNTIGNRIGEWVGLYLASMLVALAISALLVEAVGGSWLEVFKAIVDGSIFMPGRWGESIAASAPILLVAVGTIISVRAGLINIGQEGQLFVGAAFATYFGAQIGLPIGLPAPLNITVILICGAVGGGLWAAIAAALRYWRGVPEVLSTLLLVMVASQAVAYGLRHEWLLLAPEGQRGNRNAVSQQLPPYSRLPRLEIFGNEISLSAFIALGLALLVGFAFAKTIWGFRLRMLDHNEVTAHRSGVAANVYGGVALVLSGAFAGLAGAVMLAGGGFAFGNYQLGAGFAANIGWTGLLVALMARNKALAAVLVSFVFAMLRTGANFVSSTGIESRITDVIAGLLVLALLFPIAVMTVRKRKPQHKPPKNDTNPREVQGKPQSNPREMQGKPQSNPKEMRDVQWG